MSLQDRWQAMAREGTSSTHLPAVVASTGEEPSVSSPNGGAATFATHVATGVAPPALSQGEKVAKVAALPDCDGSDAIAEAHALGWTVENRASGLLIDCCGGPYDAALLDRLHALDLPEAWPDHLLADPAEIVLRGELDEIEREFGQ